MPDADPYSRLAAVYDEMVIDACHHRWAAHLHELWRSDETGVHTVLDLCCGTGLMSAELVALGYRVVGVDRSPSMLARARRLLGPDAVLVRQALPELTIDAGFDAVVSTFDGLNYLNPTELVAALSAVACRLRPGGWLVFDLHTDAMMDFTVQHPVVEGQGHGRLFTISSVVDVSARVCTTRIVVTPTTDDGEAFTEEHRQYFLSDEQVRRSLTTAGFAVSAVTDEYSHVPVDGSSLRATWTARRVAQPGADPSRQPLPRR